MWTGKKKIFLSVQNCNLQNFSLLNLATWKKKLELKICQWKNVSFTSNKFLLVIDTHSYVMNVLQKLHHGRWHSNVRCGHSEPPRRDERYNELGERFKRTCLLLQPCHDVRLIKCHRWTMTLMRQSAGSTTCRFSLDFPFLGVPFLHNFLICRE